MLGAEAGDECFVLLLLLGELPLELPCETEPRAAAAAAAVAAACAADA